MEWIPVNTPCGCITACTLWQLEHSKAMEVHIRPTLPTRITVPFIVTSFPEKAYVYILTFYCYIQIIISTHCHLIFGHSRGFIWELNWFGHSQHRPSQSKTKMETIRHSEFQYVIFWEPKWIFYSFKILKSCICGRIMQIWEPWIEAKLVLQLQ